MQNLEQDTLCSAHVATTIGETNRYFVHEFVKASHGYIGHIHPVDETLELIEPPPIHPLKIDFRGIPIQARHYNAWFDLEFTLSRSPEDVDIDVGTTQAQGEFGPLFVTNKERLWTRTVYTSERNDAGISAEIVDELAPDWLEKGCECYAQLSLTYDESGLIEHGHFEDEADIDAARERVREEIESYGYDPEATL